MSIANLQTPLHANVANCVVLALFKQYYSWHHNCNMPHLFLSLEFYHNFVPNFLSPLYLTFLFKCMKTKNGVTALKF